MEGQRPLVAARAVLMSPKAGQPQMGQGRDYSIGAPDDEPCIVLKPKPRKACRAVASMRMVDDKGAGYFWIVKVKNLPQYPYEETFFRNTEDEARTLIEDLEPRLKTPLDTNPEFPTRWREHVASQDEA